MIIPKYQPLHSNLCGQACVAMICDISLARSVKAVGKASVTTGPDLAHALELFDIKSSPAMIRMGGNQKPSRKSDYYTKLPKRCIAKCRSVGFKGSHWVLIWDGTTYDPAARPGKVGFGCVPWEYISGYIEIIEK